MSVNIKSKSPDIRTVMTMKPIYLDQQQTADVLSISISTLEKLVREGQFPRPRELSGRRVGWLVREIEEWAEARPVSSMLPPANTAHCNRRRRASADNADSTLQPYEKPAADVQPHPQQVQRIREQHLP